MVKSTKMTITYAIAAAVLGLALSSFYITGALADNPHFISASATINSAGQLVCNFKEVGLGTTTSTEQITCSGTATAVYQCFNNGGKHPQAGNKQTIQSSVSGTGSFPVRNGQTTGSLTVQGTPPGPGGFSCPSGQTLYLVSIQYDNVIIKGQAGDQAGPFSTGTQTVMIKISGR
jgi:hypothetical protein